jgi:hypothetical protein
LIELGRRGGLDAADVGDQVERQLIGRSNRRFDYLGVNFYRKNLHNACKQLPIGNVPRNSTQMLFTARPKFVRL